MSKKDKTKQKVFTNTSSSNSSHSTLLKCKLNKNSVGQKLGAVIEVPLNIRPASKITKRLLRVKKKRAGTTLSHDQRETVDSNVNANDYDDTPMNANIEQLKNNKTHRTRKHNLSQPVLPDLEAVDFDIQRNVNHSKIQSRQGDLDTIASCFQGSQLYFILIFMIYFRTNRSIKITRQKESQNCKEN